MKYIEAGSVLGGVLRKYFYIFMMILIFVSLSADIIIKRPVFLARAAGVAGAFNAASEGSYGIFYNPSGMSFVLGYEAQITHSFFPGGIYDSAILINPDPIMNWGKIGIAFSRYSGDNGASVYSIVLGSAFDIIENALSYGVNVSFNSAYSGEQRLGSCAGIDTGMLYRTLINGSLFKAGAVYTSTGNDSALTGSGLMFPNCLKLSISDEFDFFGGRVLAAGGASFDFEAGPAFSAGAEFMPGEALSFRAGYSGGMSDYFSLGAGINGENTAFHYGVNFHAEGGSSHVFSFLHSWGTPPSRISVAPDIISPNGDGAFDKLYIYPRLREEALIKSMQLDIYGEKGQVKKKTVRINGVKTKEIAWDGKAGGKILGDGKYMVSLESEYMVNGASESNKAAFEIDTTPPSLFISAAPEYIRKNKKNALLIPAVFTMRAEDENVIMSWQLTVRKENGEVFFTKKEEGPLPAGYTWDGRGSGGKYVKSENIYSYSLSAVDSAGNSGVSGQKEIPVLLREIKLTYSSDALFDREKADVKPRAYKKLKGIKKVLEKYGESVVIIRGFTDNRESPGVFKTRKRLSSARAKAVRFFITNLLDVKGRKIIVEGMGSSRPVATNSTPAGRAKNRRVEVMIRSAVYR